MFILIKFKKNVTSVFFHLLIQVYTFYKLQRLLLNIHLKLKLMKKIYLILTTMLVAVFYTANAQLYSYIDDPSGNYASVALNATGTNLSRVNGTLEQISCPTGFVSYEHSKSTTYGNGRPSIQFSVMADAGFQLNVTNISVDIRRNPKGPTTWRLAYSLDGGTSWTNSGTDFFVESSNCLGGTNLSWDVTDFSTVNSMLVRVIGFSAHSALNGESTLRNIMVDGSVSIADEDGDGFTIDVDCNDTDAAINPDATEVCNGIDDNCNGDIDDGAGTIWYADADGDTYGNDAATTIACSVPDGYVGDNTDCNDANADINPAASEICNGLDDNCNGSIDEDLIYDIWYADADGDGYGDAASAVTTCDGAPIGYVADNTDCNDGNDGINPEAAETCNGIDDNCNGFVDEGIDLSIAISPTGIITLCKPDEITLSATPGFDSYQWYKNGAALTGENDIDYTTNKPAYYQVEGLLGTCTSGLSEVQAVAVVESPNANILYPDGLNLCDVSPLLLKASYADDNVYQWYLNGDEIAGATNWDYLASEIGDYTCMITNAFGCSRTADAVTVINQCRDAEAAIVSKMDVFPNPAKNEINISLNTGFNTNEVATVILSDITGRSIYSVSNPIANGNLFLTIDIPSNITDGIYTLTVKTGSQQLNERVVIIK